MTHMMKANEIIVQLVETSPDVQALMSRLTKEKNMNENERTEIQNQLQVHYTDALSHHSVPPEYASMLAFSVNLIGIVMIKCGESIIGYFLCNTVKALLKLHEMIESGFMHRIFAEIIKSQHPAIVDVVVYVNPDDFKSRLTCLVAAQEKGLSVDTQLVILIL